MARPSWAPKDVHPGRDGIARMYERHVGGPYGVAEGGAPSAHSTEVPRRRGVVAEAERLP
jgi:hypothetical protein